jgi:hypothetical protein
LSLQRRPCQRKKAIRNVMSLDWAEDALDLSGTLRLEAGGA